MFLRPGRPHKEERHASGNHLPAHPLPRGRAKAERAGGGDACARERGIARRERSRAAWRTLLRGERGGESRTWEGPRERPREGQGRGYNEGKGESAGSREGERSRSVIHSRHINKRSMKIEKVQPSSTKRTAVYIDLEPVGCIGASKGHAPCTLTRIMHTVGSKWSLCGW